MARLAVRWRDWPLVTKVATLIVLFAIVPLLSVTLYNAIVVRENLVAATRQQNLARAKGTADTLDLHLKETLADADLLAVSPLSIRLFSETDNAANRLQLAMTLVQIREYRHVAGAFVTDNNGVVLLASDQQLVGNTYSTSPWFRSAVAGQSAIDEPRYDDAAQQVYLHATAPVRDRGGAIKGVAVVRTDIRTIDAIADAQTPTATEGAFGLMWDDLGVRLSQTGHPELRFMPLAALDPSLAQQLAVEKRYGPAAGTMLATQGGNASLVEQTRLLFYGRQAYPYITINTAETGPAQCAVAPLTAKRWAYAVCTPDAQIQAIPNAQMRNALLIALVVAAVAAGIAVVFARSATKPLLLVAQAANAMAAGDMSRRVGLAQRDEVGQLAGHFDAMADALQRKEAKIAEYANRLEGMVLDRTRELQQSLDRVKELDAIIRESPAAALASGGEPGMPLRYVAGNFEQWGFAQEDFIAGRVTLAEVVHPDDRERVAEVTWQCQQERCAQFGREYRIVDAGGRTRWVKDHFRLFTEPGGGYGYRGILIDITELKQVEEELRLREEDVRRLNTDLEQIVRDRTSELEDANRELEAFARSVSQDLRKPLRAVDGFTRMILEENGPALSAEVYRQLGVVRANAQRMTQLVEDLVSFSQLRSQPLSRHTIAMADIVQRAWQECEADRSGRQVELVLGDLPNCRADPALIRQVWANLISNALKFTSRCERARIEVSSHPDGAGQTVFFVKDNGVGFDMRSAGQLFNVFHRLHRAGEYPGSGVGLAIVRRIIGRHGGRVWAEAEPGKGAAFYFTLPPS